MAEDKFVPTGRDKRNANRTTRILKRIETGKTTAEEQKSRAKKLTKPGDNTSDRKDRRRLERAVAINNAVYSSQAKSTSDSKPKPEVVDPDLRKKAPAAPAKKAEATKPSATPAAKAPATTPEAPKKEAPVAESVTDYGKGKSFSEAWTAHRDRLISAQKTDNADQYDAYFVWNGKLYSAAAATDTEFNYKISDDMKQYVKPKSEYTSSAEKPVTTSPGTSTETPVTTTPPAPVETKGGGQAEFDTNKGGYVTPSQTVSDPVTPEVGKAPVTVQDPGKAPTTSPRPDITLEDGSVAVWNPRTGSYDTGDSVTPTPTPPQDYNVSQYDTDYYKFYVGSDGRPYAIGSDGRVRQTNYYGAADGQAYIGGSPQVTGNFVDDPAIVEEINGMASGSNTIIPSPPVGPAMAPPVSTISNEGQDISANTNHDPALLDFIRRMMPDLSPEAQEELIRRYQQNG